MELEKTNFDFLTDSHCHLDDERFAEDFDEILQRARDAGVGRIIAVNTLEGAEGSRRAVDIAKKYGWINAVVGLHPHEARLFDYGLLEELERLIRLPEVVAVGEIGLDYHYDNSPRARQRAAFREFIKLARRAEKPVVIHSREAEEDTLKILDEEKGWETGGVVHCFSGGPDMAAEIIKKGFYLSFSGVITFPHAGNTRSILASVPTNKVLIETDAPYLAPVPRRGRRNEPAYVKYTAIEYARIRKLSGHDVWRTTSLNAAKLFNLGYEPAAQIAYMIRNSLYLNITNKCTLSCTFCPKRRDWMVKGHYLRLRSDPPVQSIKIEASKYDLRALDEVVFCGFGEPTQRLSVLLEIAAWLKREGVKKIRLDTDGLGNLIHGRNIVDDLKKDVDTVSVSMNAPDAETYLSFCPNPYDRKAYEAMKDFISLAKGHFKDVVATIVGMPGIEMEKCRKIAEDELGVYFRVREYNEVG